MRRGLGYRRIVATVLVMGATGAGLVVAGGSVGAREARLAPNCQIPADAREPAPEPAPALIIEPLPVEGTCATLRVTKVVHGTAPAGTTFTVIVQCSSTDPDRLPPDRTEAQQLPQGQVPPFAKVLTFPEAGGTQDVLNSGLSSCTVDEPPPAPGCSLAGVTPATTEITQPQVYPVFVTNTCASQSSPVNIQGTIVVNQPPAVVAAPRFTR
jgi:hypothetical protein